MKNLIMFAAVVSFLAACNSNSEHAATTEAQAVVESTGTAYTIDSTTTVTWTGSKPTGSHEGTFRVKEGTLMVTNNALTGGSFTIDINSLNNVDLASDPKSKGDLEGHLKSADFFDVAKYPNATFAITAVEPFTADSSNKVADATHVIKGNLTLKDSTKNISFPAKVTVNENTVTAFADFDVDRTQWGMNYKGPNNPADWVISKTVNIKLSLAASKK